MARPDKFIALIKIFKDAETVKYADMGCRIISD